MATKRKGHAGGQNPPGYVPPSRQGKRFLVSPVEPDLFAAMHELTAREGTTIGKAIERLCRDFVEKRRYRPRRRRPSPAKAPSLDC
jgi:hypothetical protein